MGLSGTPLSQLAPNNSPLHKGNELAREVGLAHQNPAELIAWVKDKQHR
jgi:hypothetical protein